MELNEHNKTFRPIHWIFYKKRTTLKKNVGVPENYWTSYLI